jgi:uroporphyrinogen III methyltransferase/synthase
VVRLKAGDPLVFGRGGEEAQELAAAGVPFEIVPGISAALGAAAYGGIPLTHREHAAQLAIATGHRGDGGLPPPESAAGRTLVLYMATRELEKNLAEARAAGWPADTPAALIVAATTSEERIVTGTLVTLADHAARTGVLGVGLPALVVVGRVVALREGIAWREHLPLHGRRVVVARARTAPSRVALALRTLGADALELPHVDRGSRPRATPPARWPSRVDLVVLVASSAARALYSIAPPHMRAVPTVAIGERTAAAARSFGVRHVRIASNDGVDALVATALDALSADVPRVPSHALLAEVVP